MTGINVLITEPVDETLIKALKEGGLHVDFKPGLTKEELKKIIRSYDILIVRSKTIVDSEIIEAGSGRLKVIARAGVGLDNIDVEEAARRGILVLNAGDAPIESVAELTIALILTSLRRIDSLITLVKNGGWERPLGRELAGKTVLIVGFGRIGRRVAELLKAFGSRVLAYDVLDIRVEAEKRNVEVVTDLCAALSQADIVTLHVPLNKHTYKLINRDLLEKCFKRGAVLVNTSRGAVVDSEAILWALESNILSVYATDVLEEEPPKSDILKTLVSHPRVIVTPHIGSQTIEAQERIAETLSKKILEIVGERGVCLSY